VWSHRGTLVGSPVCCLSCHLVSYGGFNACYEPGTAQSSSPQTLALTSVPTDRRVGSAEPWATPYLPDPRPLGSQRPLGQGPAMWHHNSLDVSGGHWCRPAREL
jgi:hypothetical protein